MVPEGGLCASEAISQLIVLSEARVDIGSGKRLGGGAVVCEEIQPGLVTRIASVQPVDNSIEAQMSVSAED